PPPSRRPSAAPAARTCPRSDTRTGAERERGPALPRTSLDLTLHGRVIREESAADPPPRLRPAHRRSRRRPADEDVVDPLRRRTFESPHRANELRQDTRVLQGEVEVAAEDDRLVRIREPVDERR